MEAAQGAGALAAFVRTVLHGNPKGAILPSLIHDEVYLGYGLVYGPFCGRPLLTVRLASSKFVHFASCFAW